ncbi:MAG: STAS domain-containing protein [Bacteroidales bacterium]
MITVDEKGGILIARLTSEDRFNALIADRVKDMLLSYYATPGTKLVFDLEGIKFIDSSGFGVFLSLMKAANNSNGKFKICNLKPDVMELFQVLQLHNVFDIYNSFDECVSSFKEEQ